MVDDPRADEAAEALATEVEAALAALVFPPEPAELYAPVRYVLAGGGKRVRPVLTLLAAEAFGGPDARRRALPAALAVETFHNFTLVHDDIMDHAATRRGRPTVHTVWDERVAILAGDLMMGRAYRLLDGLDAPPAVRDEARARFHDMVDRLCEGQALDLAFEARADVSVEAYLDMIDRKTGALLVLALDLGALVGGAADADRQRLREAGHALGRAFQIQDDLLDLTAEAAALGKTVGGDLAEGKRTFLLLRALERASGSDRAWFARILNGGLDPAHVDDARQRMARLGVLDDARQSVDAATRTGLDGLAVLPDAPAAAALRALAARLAGRAA